MSKLGTLLGMTGAAAAYAALNGTGCIDDLFMNGIGQISEWKQFVDGAFVATGTAGVVGTIGHLAGRVSDYLKFKKLDAKTPKYVEGAVDSALVAAMLENEAPRQFVRDNILYKWGMQSNGLENFLEFAALAATAGFTIGLAYKIIKGTGEGIEARIDKKK